MSPDFPTIPSLIFAGLWVLFLLALYAVLFHIGPSVAAAMRVIRTAKPVAFMDCGCEKDGRAQYFCMNCDAVRCQEHKDPHSCPDPVDVHAEDAILLTHEAVDLDDPMHGVDFTVFETEFARNRKARRLAAKLEERAR